MIVEEYVKWEKGLSHNHAGHAFSSRTLLEIERALPRRLLKTAETGCGKSTILFSNLSEHHTVFALDDRDLADKSSVLFYENCPLTRRHVVHSVFGPTQRTLLSYTHEGLYDAVLIDGPHGWPFPELEYLMLYPHIRPGGHLIVDDVNIPTIGRMADIIAEDDMFELQVIVAGTAIFKRTSAPTFPPTGDGWWAQKFNRRRVSSAREIFLSDGMKGNVISDQKLDHLMFPPDGEKVPG